MPDRCGGIKALRSVRPACSLGSADEHLTLVGAVVRLRLWGLEAGSVTFESWNQELEGCEVDTALGGPVHT